MSAIANEDFAAVAGDGSLTFQRLLPGPAERVWDYLTRSELRKTWLAAGDMPLTVGAPFTFTWRNDELTSPPGAKPDGFGSEHSMTSEITELDPPRRLAFTWSGSGDVSFDLAPQGDDVMLTVTHRQLRDRAQRLGVGTGWHSHLDLLGAVLRGDAPEPFWDRFTRVRTEYDALLTA